MMRGVLVYWGAIHVRAVPIYNLMDMRNEQLPTKMSLSEITLAAAATEDPKLQQMRCARLVEEQPDRWYKMLYTRFR